MDNQTQNETSSFNEYREIVKALQPYIDGAKNGNGELGTSTFFDHTRVVGSIGGNFSINTKDEFKTAMNSMGAAPTIKHHIAWVDISGPAAAAKVEFLDWKGFRFTDFFILYKQEGTWKISGKSFNSHSQN